MNPGTYLAVPTTKEIASYLSRTAYRAECDQDFWIAQIRAGLLNVYKKLQPPPDARIVDLNERDQGTTFSHYSYAPSLTNEARWRPIIAMAPAHIYTVSSVQFKMNNIHQPNPDNYNSLPPPITVTISQATQPDVPSCASAGDNSVSIVLGTDATGAPVQMTAAKLVDLIMSSPASLLITATDMSSDTTTSTPFTMNSITPVRFVLKLCNVLITSPQLGPNRFYANVPSNTGVALYAAVLSLVFGTSYSTILEPIYREMESYPSNLQEIDPGYLPYFGEATFTNIVSKGWLACLMPVPESVPITYQSSISTGHLLYDLDAAFNTTDDILSGRYYRYTDNDLQEVQSYVELVQRLDALTGGPISLDDFDSFRQVVADAYIGNMQSLFIACNNCGFRPLNAAWNGLVNVVEESGSLSNWLDAILTACANEGTAPYTETTIRGIIDSAWVDSHMDRLFTDASLNKRQQYDYYAQKLVESANMACAAKRRRRITPFCVRQIPCQRTQPTRNQTRTRTYRLREPVLL